MTRFPAFGTEDTFSCPWQQLHVFPRLAPAPCFPAFATCYKFFFYMQQIFTFCDGDTKPLYKQRFDEYTKVCFRLTVVASFASMGTTPWSVITAKFSPSFAMLAMAAQTLASTWNTKVKTNLSDQAFSSLVQRPCRPGATRDGRRHRLFLADGQRTYSINTTFFQFFNIYEV